MQPKSKRDQELEEAQDFIRMNDEFSLFRADRILQALINSYPSWHSPYFLLGVVRAQQGDIKAALGYHDAAIAIEPKDLSARLNKANLLSEAGRPRDTLVELESIEQTIPSVSPRIIQQIRGRAHLELLELEEARKAFESNIGMGSADPSIFVLKVCAGDLEGAVQNAATLAGTGYRPMPANTLGAFRAEKETVRGKIKPLFFFVTEALQEGYTSDIVLRSLDTPPEDIPPGTMALVDWWHQELSVPDWEESVRATMDLLSDPELTQEIQEGLSEPDDELVSWADLKSTLDL